MVSRLAPKCVHASPTRCHSSDACCSSQEGSNGVGAELAASPRRQVAGPSRGRDPPSMVVQGDFRKVSLQVVFLEMLWDFYFKFVLTLI